MRIISGKYRGRQIHPPPGFKARPTTDFAKEALFNIIENHFNIEELSVLDLFAGTGSISLEFASRGAQRVTCVEKDSGSFKFIRKMVIDMELDEVNTIRSDAFRILKNPWEPYDLIFADPPYDLAETEQIPTLVFDKELLAEDGWLVIEHSGKTRFIDDPHLFDQRKYGSVNFSFFRK